MSEWRANLHPARCAQCHAEYLVTPNAGAPLCPNCFGARLEPMPTLAHDIPPELFVPFSAADATLNANLTRWLREIPFRAPSLNERDLRARLTRVFLPMYLADTRVAGTWQAQLGFDYLVASSQERYNAGQWMTQRLNETRIRWEPRAGEISRAYENVDAPALEQHARIMSALGDAERRSSETSLQLPFDTTRAIPFSTDALKGALMRAAEMNPEAAWNFARAQVERRAAKDCTNAASAQHYEQFEMRVTYAEPRWTLLLLPMFVTSYLDDDGKWIPVRVNGQTGFVSGTQRASLKQARRWTIIIGALTLLVFLFTALVAFATLRVSGLAPFAGIFLVITFLLLLAAFVPMIVVWQFNRSPKK